LEGELPLKNSAAVALVVKVSIRRAIAAGIDLTFTPNRVHARSTSCRIRFKFVKVLIGLRFAQRERAGRNCRGAGKRNEPHCIEGPLLVGNQADKATLAPTVRYLPRPSPVPIPSLEQKPACPAARASSFLSPVCPWSYSALHQKQLS
jgi:hypothetical protein